MKDAALLMLVKQRRKIYDTFKNRARVCCALFSYHLGLVYVLQGCSAWPYNLKLDKLGAGGFRRLVSEIVDNL